MDWVEECDLFNGDRAMTEKPFFAPLHCTIIQKKTLTPNVHHHTVKVDKVYTIKLLAGMGYYLLSWVDIWAIVTTKMLLDIVLHMENQLLTSAMICPAIRFISCTGSFISTATM